MSEKTTKMVYALADDWYDYALSLGEMPEQFIAKMKADQSRDELIAHIAALEAAGDRLDAARWRTGGEVIAAHEEWRELRQDAQG